MKNKGFTTIELIVSFTLVTVITILLFQLIFVLKDLYVNSGLKIKLLTKSAKMSIPINDDIITKNLISAKKINNYEIELGFADGTKKVLGFNREERLFSYGDLVQELVDGSEFDNIIIKSETFLSTFDTETLNSILTIKIPVKTNLMKGESFGVNIVYLYNSNAKPDLSGLNVSNIVVSENNELVLNCATNLNDPDSDECLTTAFKDTVFVDPGYQEQNGYTVETTGMVDTSREGVYYITYTKYDQYRNLIDQKVRTVNVIRYEHFYEYTGDIQQLTVTTSGKYFIRLWGASGGGSDSMSGKGGYTEGYFNFSAGDVLNIYVGGKGTMSTSGTAALGGYNGGGSSGSSTSNFAGSGGGATDIRLNGTDLDDQILVAGGGGGAGSVNDSIYYCFGGSGGGESGTSCNKCDAYSGIGASQTAGGSASTYSLNLTSNPTAGIRGEGGVGASYSNESNTYAAGGGGGGYYGGGGGARYGSGGGGSGYCGTAYNCYTFDGTNLISKPGTDKYEKGHSGDGYAIIKLVSTIIE